MGFWGQSDKLTWTLLTYNEMISGLQVSLWLQGSFSRLCPWILHFVLFIYLLLSLSRGIILTLVVSLFPLLAWLGHSAVVWTINPSSWVGVFLVSSNWILFQTDLFLCSLEKCKDFDRIQIMGILSIHRAETVIVLQSQMWWYWKGQCMLENVNRCCVFNGFSC